MSKNLQKTEPVVNHAGKYSFPEEMDWREIRQNFTPANRSERANVVAGLMAGLRHREGDDATNRATAQMYMLVMEGWPRFVVEAAAKAYVLGRAETQNEKNRAFLPATSELTIELELQFSQRICRHAGVADKGTQKTLRPFGKAWMAYRLHLLASESPVDYRISPTTQAMYDEGRVGDVFIAKMQRQGERPKLAKLDVASKGEEPHQWPDDFDPGNLEGYVTIEQDSNAIRAWEKWHNDNAYPWIELPKHIKFIWVPVANPAEFEMVSVAA